MNKLKCYLIIGIFFVILTGTLSHFVYDWSGQNFILGFFFPVNESTWEHMKLIFFPMLVYTCLVSKTLKDSYPCITSALLLATILGTLLIPVLFYTYSGILGKNYAPFDIAVYVISVILGFEIVYRDTLSCQSTPYKYWIEILVFVMFICFLLFTYSPPNIGIFIDPTQS